MGKIWIGWNKYKFIQRKSYVNQISAAITLPSLNVSKCLELLKLMITRKISNIITVFKEIDIIMKKGGFRPQEQYGGEFDHPYKSISVITLHSIAMI